MGEPAKATYIPDPEGAADALAAMAASAEILQDKVQAAVTRIARHEAGRPWGTAPEFGGRFESVYRAGPHGGADFVKDNARLLADETLDGVTLANQALHGSVQLDHDAAGLFRVAGSDGVGRALTDIAGARAEAAGSGE